MVYKLIKTYTNAISMLIKNSFLLLTKTQDYYLKHHDVDICSLKEITCIDEWNHIGN